MPSRFRLPRQRARLRLQSGAHRWSVFLPDPDDLLVVAGFADASVLALDVVELASDGTSCTEAVVLLDDDRRVTAILIDPPPEVALGVGLAAAEGVPGLEAPFAQTLIVLARELVPLTPDDDVRQSFHTLRRAHAAQGLRLLDVVLTDGDRVHSVAIAVDRAPAWFDDVTAAPAGGT